VGIRLRVPFVGAAEFSGGVFGSEAPQVLRRIWRAWLVGCFVSSYSNFATVSAPAGARKKAKPLAEAARVAEQELHEALGRRRKGRDEAEESLARLTTVWAEQARLAAAERSAGCPWRLIAVRILPPAQIPAWRGRVRPAHPTLWVPRPSANNSSRRTARWRPSTCSKMPRTGPRWLWLFWRPRSRTSATSGSGVLGAVFVVMARLEPRVLDHQ
jgi:hypothetical protein